MAQRKQLTWTELRVGLFVLVGMFVLLVGIFYVTGAGILRAKYQLRTFLPEVEGLKVGAPVRLDGLEIGNVDSIRMNPQPGGDRMRNIEILMRIDQRYRDEIRTDSSASLITEGLLGNRYVTIVRGVTGTPIETNGEVRGVEEKAIKQIVERGADLVQNLNVLSSRVNELIEGIEKGKGTVGKLLVDEELYRRLANTAAGAERIVADVDAGKGSLGKLLKSEDLYVKVDSSVTRVDTLLADIQSQKGTLGKIIYDPAFYDQAKQFVERGNALVGDVREGKGTLGKLVTEDTLFVKLRDAASNVESATSKLNTGESTMGKFFTDPKFYDNMTGLAGDMRLLLGEFRQNPKKFLRVKFSIF
jgi:phospholipid/cholesterol/gamma-HCH transport system substrate-binding protein